MSHFSQEDTPTSRQKAFVAKAAEKVTRIAQGRNEFVAMGLFDRIRSMGIPQLALQRVIHETALKEDIELQTFRHYVYRGDSAAPYGPLVVRVVSRGDEEVMPALTENDALPNHAGQAIDVYPPVV